MMADSLIGETDRDKAAFIIQGGLGVPAAVVEPLAEALKAVAVGVAPNCCLPRPASLSLFPARLNNEFSEDEISSSTASDTDDAVWKLGTKVILRRSFCSTAVNRFG